MSGPRTQGGGTRGHPQQLFGQQNLQQNPPGFGFLQCVGTARRQPQIQRPPEMSSLFGGNQSSMHALQVGGSNTSSYAVQVDGVRASGGSSQRMRSLHQAPNSYTTPGLHRDGDRQQTDNKMGAWMRMPPRGSARGMMVAATRIQSLDDLPANRPQGGREDYGRDGMMITRGSSGPGSLRFSHARDMQRAGGGGVATVEGRERDSNDFAVGPASFQQLRAPESGVSQKELLPRETKDKNYRLMVDYRLRSKRDGSPASSVSASPLASLGSGGMRSVLGGLRKVKQQGSEQSPAGLGGGGAPPKAASKKKEQVVKEAPAAEPAPAVAAANGEVKIDISKAHSIFYVPCIKKAVKVLPFMDTLPPSARNDANASIYWHDRLDVPLTKYHVGRLKNGQKINRFLTMQYQARKNPLAKKLNRLQQLFPKDYDFHPVSYRFPAEVATFKKHAKKWQTGKDGSPDVGKPVYYILKPDNGSKGQGICLAEHSQVLQKWAQMSLINDDDDDGDDECTDDDGKGARGRQGAANSNSADAKKAAAKKKKKKKKKSRVSRKNAPMPNYAAGEGRQIVVQEYLDPFLLSGHKFDLRLYVVLASVNPLEVYICRQGMVRRAMVQYETPDDSNIKELHMHLTNTSLNSKFTEDSSSDESSESSDGGSDDDEDDDDEPAACKQYLGIVMDQLKSMGVDTKALWNDIMRIVSHTMSAIQPELAIAYTSAFMKPENAVSMAKRGQKKKGPQVASLAQRVISNTLDFTRCFQIIGFDILLDKNCKPYIIEINHNPSFKLPTPIDVDIKVAAMTGCLGIVTDRLMVSPQKPVRIPSVPTASGTEHILDQGGGWSKTTRKKAGSPEDEDAEPLPGIEWGKDLISSRDLFKILSYTQLPSVPERLAVFDRVFKLHEAVCTQAIVRSLENQSKSLEEQGKPAMVFGSSAGATKTARRGIEMLSPAELRDKDTSILQDMLARARLPKGVVFDTQKDFKAVFPLSRTTVAHVLLVDGLCDGLVELAKMVSKSVLAGDVEARPAPKGAMEIELGSWEGSVTASDALVALVSRLFLVI